MSSEDANAKLLRLQTAYLENLENIQPLLMRFLRMLKEETLGAKAADELKTIAHKLAGSAGGYGFKNIGSAAKQLEMKLDQNGSDASPSEILTNIALLSECISDATASAAPTLNFVAANEQTVVPAIRSRHLVLIADDDPLISNLLHSLFGDDLDVKIVENGRDVEKEIDAHNPDLVLLDDNMPGMRGIEIIEKMHKTGKLETTPVVMLTANDRPENVMRAMSYGAVDYYTKPFEPMEIVNRVRTLLDRMDHSVLIIDDDPTIHNLLGARFEMSGLRVISASDGREALSLLDKNAPDLIVLDRMMPGMEGGAVLHQIRQNSAHANIPVIMLTARSAKGDAHEWMRRGATDFVLKPFDPNELVLRAMRILNIEEAA